MKFPRVHPQPFPSAGSRCQAWLGGIGSHGQGEYREIDIIDWWDWVDPEVWAEVESTGAIRAYNKRRPLPVDDHVVVAREVATGAILLVHGYETPWPK